MAKVNVGINGFGRIGRAAFKQLLEGDRAEVVAVNDLADVGDLAYLLQYDSVYGRFDEVRSDGSSLTAKGSKVPFFSHSHPREIPWKEVGAQVVIESTGAFRGRREAAAHLEAGAERVIISAPSSDVEGTFVPGVNEDEFDPVRHQVVSLASCTTNCLAPVVKVLQEVFGVDYVMFTTVHAYTSSQSLVDTPVRKRRRGRAAALSVIPTTTGAAQATERVLPELEGRIDGMAMRVPVPDGSVTDLVAQLQQDVTPAQVNEAFRKAAERPRLERVLAVTEDELVSQDIVGDPHSAIVDASSTRVLKDRVAKVVAWYDNEWGYAARLVDFAAHIGGA
ncbi:MAG: type I glyceraldehyde-3-phosphate dehydrogenase [Actinomycetota bacterium]|nr:type I glyceraldehyde-3-phosphate dehydrogenase [Actinomycetota bacterium]